MQELGFTPVTPDIMSNSDVIAALKKHVSFPGQVLDDTAIFHLAQDHGMQVYKQSISVSASEFSEIQSRVINDINNSPMFDKTYSFPEPPYNCAPYNCATWPSTNGIPIPESSGVMTDYMKILAEIGTPWRR